MAKTLKCQPTYISQILNGAAHFSLEQADAINFFFSHSQEESVFFLLLVQKERAGTRSLKAFIQVQIDDVLSKRSVISERLGRKATLTSEQESIYYSSWHYAAIHVALTVSKLRTKIAISNYLRIPPKKVDQVLKFLVEEGLAKTDGREYRTGEVQIHMGNNSTNQMKNHSHWRHQALESLDREELTDLHYSMIVSLSRESVLKIQNLILSEIKSYLTIINNSPEEELFAYMVDFFSMKR